MKHFTTYKGGLPGNVPPNLINTLFWTLKVSYKGGLLSNFPQNLKKKLKFNET